MLDLCMSCILDALKTGFMAQDFSKNHLLFLFDYFDLTKELHC
jgi:hypothetical protein